MTIFAIDAGNTRVKWGVHKDGQWLADGAVAHPDIVRLGEAWKPFGTPASIVISNVAGEKARSALSVLFLRYKVAPVWVSAVQEQCGVKNRYQTPGLLGSDRWAALIAARTLEPGSAIVVNAGTAITADALTEQGEFLGGLIVPGIKLMMDALYAKTAGARAESGEFRAFPTNTMDAVYSGALQAALGAIERMRAEMTAAGHPAPSCVLSGGAADQLESRIARPLRRVDNLVLEGLVRIAETK
jgi:type III pantothenate kinase